MSTLSSAPITLAIPKGRLQEKITRLLNQQGIRIDLEDRKLTALDAEEKLKIILVKNSDLPTYVNFGIAGLGICGDDVIYESAYPFYRLHTFSFGGTRMCLAGKKNTSPESDTRHMTIATKYPRFATQYYHSLGISVRIIKLGGSVELAPVLGLAPFIVDLVETGETLRANNLEIIEILEKIDVHLIANPAYYKLHYERINAIVDLLKRG
ncbi:MAG: ATP phosphoribosyltransferase [Spirochaetales bacterium]|nr:ATP phosphoribosyltransferase [Spirochaetales bacterium]